MVNATRLELQLRSGIAINIQCQFVVTICSVGLINRELELPVRLELMLNRFQRQICGSIFFVAFTRILQWQRVATERRHDRVVILVAFIDHVERSETLPQRMPQSLIVRSFERRHRRNRLAHDLSRADLRALMEKVAHDDGIVGQST